jgi:hypothetical protein
MAAIPCFTACELFFPDDSGSAADAGADAATEAGAVSPVPCADAQAMLCEDFEQGMIDPNRWTSANQQGGSSVVDKTNPHWGSYSLHSRSNPVDSGTATVATTLKYTATFPSDFYARVFVYVPSPLPPSRELFFSLQNSNNPFPGMSLVAESGVMKLVDWAASPALVQGAPSPFPTDKWVCIEWEVHSDAGSTQVWVDDQPAISAKSTVVPSIGVLTLGMGFFPAAAQPSFECWTDDLYVDSQRVGCQE